MPNYSQHSSFRNDVKAILILQGDFTGDRFCIQKMDVGHLELSPYLFPRTTQCCIQCYSTHEYIQSQFPNVPQYRMVKPCQGLNGQVVLNLEIISLQQVLLLIVILQDLQILAMYMTPPSAITRTGSSFQIFWGKVADPLCPIHIARSYSLLSLTLEL